MHRPRIIPVLLLKSRGLVKSEKFKKYRYIGDPVNAARIFNELRADELIILDIDASREGRLIDLDIVNEIAEEVTMPFSVGGGIRSLDDIRKLIGAGVEKVIIGAKAVLEPEFVRQASDEFGSSTIAVCIDTKKDIFRRNRVVINNGEQYTGFEPVEFAKLMDSNGVGELIVQSIDRDGMMNGYDIAMIRSVSSAVNVPVIALGGAGSEGDLRSAFEQAYANGVAAGSLFVYHGKHQGVLINYPIKGDWNISE